jgi:hypothetical protein
MYVPGEFTHQGVRNQRPGIAYTGKIGGVNWNKDRVWDWTYHAYREWDGWSVEHGNDPQDHTPSAEPTDRQQLLLGWFARNEKPRN